MELSAIHVWLIVAAVLGVIEIMTVLFLALPFAFGAVATALFTLTDAGVTSQIWFFIITSSIALVIIQIWFRKYLMGKTPRTLSNTDAMIGKPAAVTEEIKGMMVKGQVKIDGMEWSAISEDEEAILPGTTVYIKAIDGVKLIVSREKPVVLPPE